MKKQLTVLALITLLLAACKAKQETTAEESAPVSPEVNAKIEAELIPPPNAKPNAPAIERLEGAIHPDLTARLQMYIEKTGKVPETIYEFANTVVDSMPPAPAGMKYAIDPADKTVKVVRK